MQLSQKFKFIIPFLFLLALLGILYRELFYSKPNELPSALLGKNVPQFTLPNMLFPGLNVTQKDLTGRVTLLNVWATWCEACILEHAMLMKITDQYHIPIYGIDYKDDTQKALGLLAERGNPFFAIASDKNGDVAIDLGIYGTPETFVISPEGKIIYRHIGIIDEKSWNEIIYPLVQRYEKS